MVANPDQGSELNFLETIRDLTLFSNERERKFDERVNGTGAKTHLPDQTVRFCKFPNTARHSWQSPLPGWRYTFKVKGALHRAMKAKDDKDATLQRVERLSAQAVGRELSSASSSSVRRHLALPALLRPVLRQQTLQHQSRSNTNPSPQSPPPLPQRQRMGGCWVLLCLVLLLFIL